MKDLDSRMRDLETYHGLRVPENTWTIVRVDGRGFSGLTEKRFAKPFDPAFYGLMGIAAEAVLTDTNGIVAYHESDEISVLLRPDFDFFDREVEKIVSATASVASVAFSMAFGAPAHFDSRVIVLPSFEHVLEYFAWRQYDARRCALNGWAHWTLIQQGGKSANQAASILHHMYETMKLGILDTHGITFEKLPGWQQRGTILYWETYEKLGLDPRTNRAVTATRRRIATDQSIPPTGIAYEEYLTAKVDAHLATTRLKGIPA